MKIRVYDLLSLGDECSVQGYFWDEVNRLKSLCGTSEGARYEYRADGMRVMKIADLTISWNPNDTEEGSGFYDEILSVNKPTTRRVARTGVKSDQSEKGLQ